MATETKTLFDPVCHTVGNQKGKRTPGIPQAIPRSRPDERAGKVKGATQNADRPAFCIVAAYAKHCMDMLLFATAERGSSRSQLFRQAAWLHLFSGS